MHIEFKSEMDSQGKNRIWFNIPKCPAHAHFLMAEFRYNYAWVYNNVCLTVGTCFYKNQRYSQGQKWDDGCAYECTCDDADHGRYSCYNK